MLRVYPSSAESCCWKWVSILAALTSFGVDLVSFGVAISYLFQLDGCFATFQRVFIAGLILSVLSMLASWTMYAPDSCHCDWHVCRWINYLVSLIIYTVSISLYGWAVAGFTDFRSECNDPRSTAFTRYNTLHSFFIGLVAINCLKYLSFILIVWAKGTATSLAVGGGTNDELARRFNSA